MASDPKKDRPPRQGGLGRAGRALSAARSGNFVPLDDNPERAKALAATFAELRFAANKAKGDHTLTDDELRSVLRAVAISIRAPEIAQPLPEQAPELWSQRDLNLRENAPQFIRRVYAKWLGQGLARKDLARLDPDLYKALSVWLSRHPEDDLAQVLPPQSDIIDDIISRLAAEYPLEVLRKLGYAIDARLRRV